MLSFRSARIVATTLLAAVALGSLSACATTGFRADVARFQQMPAPQGQSFAITAKDPAMQDSLEFAHYADLIAARMTQQGYVRAADAGQADFVVRVDYGVDRGRERIVNDGFAGPVWGPGWGFGGFGRRGFAGGRWGSPYAFGWYDPFLFGGGFDGGVRSYTIYQSTLGLTIERSKGGQRLFEGTAEAVSTSRDLTRLVPNLVDALFTDFPGNNGERVRITVPGQDRRR